MPKSMRAGSMLAGRYRLVDLLSESRGAHFWRAWDTVLSRHVAVHLIADEDERSEVLMDAARRSATLFDPHLLRVLDADHTNGICFVVNEWGEGDSLDRLLHEGPLAPRRAAWLVHEVGTMIATAHAKGIAHGRLVPENVLIDEAGSVKVIGFAVDAALNGMPEGRLQTDVVDLAAVLYAALTGKWPGVSRSAVPPAPQEHGKALRPRQVRAGVPRVLDGLCDEVLSPYPGAHDHGYDSAQAIVDALEEYVGDLTAVAAAEAARQRGNTSPRIPRIDAPLALAPETSPGAAAAAAARLRWPPRRRVAGTPDPAATDPAAVPDGDGTVALPALAALARDTEAEDAPAADSDGVPATPARRRRARAGPGGHPGGRPGLRRHHRGRLVLLPQRAGAAAPAVRGDPRTPVVRPRPARGPGRPGAAHPACRHRRRHGCRDRSRLLALGERPAAPAAARRRGGGRRTAASPAATGSGSPCSSRSGW